MDQKDVLNLLDGIGHVEINTNSLSREVDGAMGLSVLKKENSLFMHTQWMVGSRRWKISACLEQKYS